MNGFISYCRTAGRCIWNFLVGLRQQHLLWRLAYALQALFRKGALGRALYDQQGTVVRIVDCDDASSEGGRFFFVGCGNLAMGWFTLREFELQAEDIAVLFLTTLSYFGFLRVHLGHWIVLLLFYRFETFW